MLDLDVLRNTSFTQEETKSRLTKLMTDLMALTARSDLSISEHDVDEIDRAAAGFANFSANYFACMRNFALERRENLRIYRDVEIVSLGEDCFSRTIATQWGLKKSAKLGEKSTPFDLSVHPIGDLHPLISSDFDGYLEPGNLSFSEKLDYCFNPHYHVSFNHETGSKYAEDDFRELRQVYERRIQNFYDLMASGKTLVVLMHVRNPSATNDALVLDLNSLLKEKWPSARFRMIAINTSDFTKAADPSAGRQSSGVSFLDVQYPTTDYIWHLPSHCFSFEGHNFERGVVDRVKTEIDTWRTQEQHAFASLAVPNEVCVK